MYIKLFKGGIATSNLSQTKLKSIQPFRRYKQSKSDNCNENKRYVSFLFLLFLFLFLFSSVRRAVLRGSRGPGFLKIFKFLIYLNLTFTGFYQVSRVDEFGYPELR